jgi:hypothetical protein
MDTQNNNFIYARKRPPPLILVLLLGIVFSCFSLFCLAASQQTITIVVSKKASQTEIAAAEELRGYLQKYYLSDQFSVQNEIPRKGQVILLGTPQTLSQAEKYFLDKDPHEAERFHVTTEKQSGKTFGIVAGNTPLATLYAVYGLLEKLGYGFYLSYETQPAPTKEAFQFDKWELTDSTGIKDRIIFNWHNFLSGCSAWELEDWRHWITQASKMRFNTIMVHAYGNNPMFSFEHNGQSKPVGFISSSIRGRDWSTEHVNDVQRIYGGKLLFDSQVFGAQAALAPEEQRVEAATKLMQKVFSFAKDRGMNVTFALDVDTQSANPQNVILTLPESARFQTEGWFLANPGIPEGFAYYRSQIKSLISSYPQISTLVVWFRDGSNSPWRGIKVKDFPEPWKNEYAAAIKQHPALANDSQSEGIFAITKIVNAFQRALIELKREDVQLAIGSWKYHYFPAADALLPKEIGIITLDYNIAQDLENRGRKDHIAFDSPEVQSQIQVVSSHRNVIPIVWAHHDDHTYVGRPYQPFSNFNALLKQSGSSGYGILHWLTRPLDIYFSSLSQQVWQRTANQPILETCQRMAQHTFGIQQREQMGQYFYEWLMKAPQFGRETLKAFIDQPLSNPDQVIRDCQSRLKMLSNVDEKSLTREGRSHLNYYKSLEKFIIGFYQTQVLYEQSENQFKQNDFAAARQSLSKANPESVLGDFAQMARWNGATRGDMGLLISMNLRWFPYFADQRQLLRATDIRYAFRPTQHEPLAQSAGENTYFFDLKQQLWKCLGEKETGAIIRLFPGRAPSTVAEEICGSAIESDKPIALKLTSILGRSLSPGNYNVQLLFCDPDSTHEGDRRFEIEFNDGNSISLKKDDIDIFKRVGKQNQILQTSYTLEIKDNLDLMLKPVHGKAILSGIIIDPVSEAPGNR